MWNEIETTNSVKIVLIDFHTHSNASDGTLSPLELVARALERNVSLLAITDHDTVDGYKQAAAHHGESAANLQLIPGIEFSCVWSGTTIHVLGLGIDCEHPAMRAGVSRMAVAREERARKIAERLDKRGFAGALAGARAQAGESQLGRPHFAAWMVAQGHVDSPNAAFDRYLGQGKPGDVKAFWPDLAEVVEWVEGSGGAAVIAHPLKYRFTGMKLRRLITAFVEAGGSGIEVRSGRQTAEQVAHLRRLAQTFDLEISIGSDFHRDSTYGAPLGVDLQVELRANPGLRGVWERWLPAPPEAVL